jgi:NAD(P)-dependent dehydrogenase (short-subunit alcohol dehydrogenase family)
MQALKKTAKEPSKKLSQNSAVSISSSPTLFVPPPLPKDILTTHQGYTRFSKYADLNDPTAEDWDTCFAVNVKAPFFILRAALAALKANPDGGVFIMSSSIAGKIPSGSSLPYSVTKAAQLHLMKGLAHTQGPKIRVNAVLPGILLTEWVSCIRFEKQKG